MNKVLFTILMLLATVSFAYSQHTITATNSTGGTIGPNGAVPVANDANQLFTITPNTGYHTDSVVVDGTNMGVLTQYQFDTVHTDHTISAYFSINKYEITATAGSGGTIDPSGSVWVDYDANQSFDIMPNTGYHTDSVLVDGVNMGVLTEYQFDTVHVDHSISAFFSINQYEITASVSEGGTINPSGSVWVEYDASQEFVFHPNTGYHLDSVIVDGMQWKADTSVMFDTVHTNHSISVYYSINYLEIEATATEGGTITPSGSVWVAYGTDTTFEISANSGYQLDSVLVDGMNQGAVTSYEFSSVMESHTIRAFFTSTMVNVTFNVDMGIKAKKGAFNPGEDTVFASGSFNGWGADMMDDGNADSVYSFTFSANKGDTLSFKFRYWDYSTSGFVWENDPNRVFVVPNEGGTYTDFFNRDSVYVAQYDIQVYFSLNMELERLSGRFNPTNDTVSVNGSFNGWATKSTILLPNGLNPDMYEGSATVRAGLGESIEFKFWYEDNNWESVDNRVFTFADSNITSLTAEVFASFNDGTLDNVLNSPCVIKFTCNTVGAVSAISTSAFPVVNSVSIAGSALPLKWPAGGWPDSDSSNMSSLYDDGTHGDVTSGDGIFTTELTFPAYTVLNVQYKYSINFGDAANNGGGNDNEDGFGNNHLLGLNRFLTSATTVDTFGVMGTTIITDPLAVRENDEIPATYSLQQNYPNPFNPSTTITYSIPVQGLVTLHVYNTLGQQVATLVNEMQEAGNYHVSFASSSLPTGLYYYRITTGNFTDTKSMLLVK